MKAKLSRSLLFWRVYIITIFCAGAAVIIGSAFIRPVRASAEKALPEVKITITPMAAAGATNQFSVVLNWTASSSAATCTSANNCSNFGYNVFEGTTSGGEGTTPVNASLVTGTTYSYAVTLTSTAQTFYFVVQANETIASVGTLVSANSNEASVSFPAIPAAPTSLTAAP